MTILVTGANGQLGNEIRIVSKNSKDSFIFTDVVEATEDSLLMLKRIAGEGLVAETTHLDITDLNAIRSIVKNNDVEVIVNCAAYTNVDAAENNQDLAELLNATAPRNLAIAMKEVGGVLVHVSTDYVFGGDLYNVPCKEDLKGRPTGVYGLTKLQGENNIQSVGVDYIILRTAWLYSEFGKNFVKTMLNLTETKPQLRVVFDQVGTPTYAYDLALTILTILEQIKIRRKTGVYHFSNEGVCSWFDFATMIAEYTGNVDCDILPCHSDEFPSSVKRPSFSVLDKSKIKREFGIRIPYWTKSLRKCIYNLKAL